MFLIKIDGLQVGDVQWAPYSATVLAACTDNGYVHIFDIDINSHKAICIQRIVPKRKCIKLTRVEFNTELPILRIGDDRGNKQIFNNKFIYHKQIFHNS